MPTTDKKDLNLVIFGLILIAFFATVFRERLGIVYLGFLAIDGLMLLGYQAKLNMNPISGNTFKSIMYAVAAYAALFIIHFASSFFLSAVDPTFQGMIDLMRQQTVLALEESRFLEMASIIIVIPFIETRFIARLVEFLSTFFKVSYEKISFQLLLIFIVISVAFTLFHINVRKIDNVGYFITFVFGILQCYLIYKTKESESATWMHILNNGIAYFR